MMKEVPIFGKAGHFCIALQSLWLAVKPEESLSKHIKADRRPICLVVMFHDILWKPDVSWCKDAFDIDPDGSKMF